MENNGSQRFLIFTEEQWNQHKQHIKKAVQKFFSGKKNEFFVDLSAGSTDFLIGIGHQDTAAFEVQKIAQKFAHQFRNNFLPQKTAILADELTGEQLRSFYNGLFLGTYEYPSSENHTFFQPEFSLYNTALPISEEWFSEAKILQNAQALCKDWLNKPANYKNPELLSQFLKNFASQHALKLTVFNREECEKLGLGAYLAVNRGSNYDAAFTILEYQTGSSDAKTLGLVGKCVTFDTGGISIKPSENMHYMKSDMGGATAVLGALQYAAQMKLPVNIIAVLPITDNAVSEQAYLPGDVITAYNGKTIEVLNTDAEGRMTLADALSYLTANYQTDAVLDLATLTGSAVRMFGDTCAPVFSSNENLIQSLIKSGEKTGQRLWKMPLWDVWENDFTSEVADYKNISAKPVGDCIVAAKFLQQFTNEHPNWAHLDIAGVAFGNTLYGKEKGATGFGVQLLIEFMKNNF